MRFLLDANTPRSAADLLERRRHDTVHVRDPILKDAPDERITPSAGNDKTRERFGQNRFTVTRQLRYSRDETQRALDVPYFSTGWRCSPSS